MADNHEGRALTPDAATEQIAAKYADPAFMGAYTDALAQGHAAAVAAMAHLYVQAYPPGDGAWPSLAWCVQHVAGTLGLSIGTAGAKMCEACAAGSIRWSGWRIERPSPQDWRDGRIDASGRYLIACNHCHDLLWLSGDDLADWLQRRQSEPGTTRDKAPAKTSRSHVRATPSCESAFSARCRSVSKAAR